MCSCKSIPTADENFAARWAGDWQSAVIKFASETQDDDLIPVLQLLSTLTEEIMSEDTIAEGTEHWAQRFIRHAATALYDILSSRLRDFEAVQALKEQAHRLAHAKWRATIEAAESTGWKVERPELAGMSAGTLACVTLNIGKQQMLDELCDGEPEPSALRILKAMAVRLSRPIKIIQGEEGTEGDYSTLSLGERDGSGPNFCLIRWAFEFWPCTDLLAKKRAAECVRLEPGWMGTPNIIEAEQARTLGYRYLVGSVAQGSPGRSSWQDATDFIRQCYSRYLAGVNGPLTSSSSPTP